MEKHLQIFCNQNPIHDEVICPVCHAANKVKMQDYLRVKYQYSLKCSNCSAESKIDTKSFHKDLEWLKQFTP